MKSPAGRSPRGDSAQRGHGRCSGQAPAGRPRALFRPRPRRLRARPTARRKRLADGYSGCVRAGRAADRQAGDVGATWKRAPEQEAELVASALNRRLELATVRFRRTSWRRAGAATVTRARATSQRRPPDRATHTHTPVTDCFACVPAGEAGEAVAAVEVEVEEEEAAVAAAVRNQSRRPSHPCCADTSSGRGRIPPS